MADAQIRSLGPALDLRRRGQRRRRARRLGAVALVLLVVVVGSWIVLRSPLLPAKSVDVRGTTLLSTDEVVAVAEVPLGRPMATQPLQEISDRVATLAPVASVKVTRAWPSTVRVTVEERQAAYQLEVGGVFKSVDTNGVIFRESPDRQPGPVVHTANEDQRLLRDVATVMVALPASVRDVTESVDAASIDRILLNLSEGRQVNWGSAELSDQKAVVLPELLKQSGSYYDVSAPAHPAVRPK